MMELLKTVAEAFLFCQMANDIKNESGGWLKKFNQDILTKTFK